MLSRREQRLSELAGASACARSQLKTKGKTLEIREPILIVTADTSGYVLMTLVFDYYFDM